MAKLRHLALLTHQPERLADFYKRVFEMKEMYRTKNGSVHLSDGEVNLAILNASDPKEPGHQPGLYHFGFQVDDSDVVAKRIQEIYPAGAPKAREATYAEGRGSDPDGNLFDISTVGWGLKRRMDLQSRRLLKTLRSPFETLPKTATSQSPFGAPDEGANGGEIEAVGYFYCAEVFSTLSVRNSCADL